MLWLFPLTYAIHFAEELWGGEGFPAWAARVVGAPIPVETFLVLNAIGMSLMIAGVILTRLPRGVDWIPVTLAGIVLINGTAHLVATIGMRVYSPGLISGMLIWFPLGIYVLCHSCRHVSPRDWRLGWTGALLAHGVISALAYFSSR